MTQRISTTDGGTEYTLPVIITETSGKDISGDTVQIRLRASDGTGDWVSGTQSRPSASSVTVQLLVDNTYPTGAYWVETKLGDSPEEIVRTWFRVEVQ